MDAITSAKENVAPKFSDRTCMFSAGGTMNPILEVSFNQTSPAKISQSADRRKQGSFTQTEPKTAVTVSRSATVAGIVKVGIRQVLQ